MYSTTKVSWWKTSFEWNPQMFSPANLSLLTVVCNIGDLKSKIYFWYHVIISCMIQVKSVRIGTWCRATLHNSLIAAMLMGIETNEDYTCRHFNWHCLVVKPRLLLVGGYNCSHPSKACWELIHSNRTIKNFIKALSGITLCPTNLSNLDNLRMVSKLV